MKQSCAIIWDFDGMLARRDGMWSQCLAEVANESLGLALTRDAFAPFLKGGFPWHTPEVPHVHLNSPDAWWKALEPFLAAAFSGAARVDMSLARQLAMQVPDRYLHKDSWTVFPDARMALKSLSDDGWVHVLLSNHVPELASLVGALRLSGYFEAIISSANIGFEKPRKECYEIARAHLPEKVQRVVVVGDNHSADMIGASAAGLEGILVRSPPQGEYRSFEGLEGLLNYLSVR